MQHAAIKRIAIAGTILSALVAVSATWAQSRDVPAMPMSPPMMPGHGMPPVPPMGNAMPLSPVEACLDRSARSVAVMAYFKARLDLTTEQLAAWQELETASTEIAKEERDACARLPVKFESPGAMKMLSMTEERLAAMQRHLQKIGPSIRKVYAVLSPDQRKLVDSMPMAPPPMFP